MCSDKNNIFISYSHRDSKYLQRLRVHLRPLEREHEILIWDDTKINAGTNWREIISSEISKAGVAILLVSADFLASDFIVNNELPPLLKASEEIGVLILPVIIGPCRFQRTKGLSKFQAVNDPSRPLANLPVAERERIWVKVAESVEAAFKGRKIEDGWAVTNERLVRDSLIGLIQDGVDNSFLIIAVEDYYVQFLLQTSASNLLCEVISNSYLPETSKLSNEDIINILGMGFSKPKDDQSNFSKYYTLDKELSFLPEVAALVVRIFSDVYKVSKNSKFEITHGF